MLRNINFGDMTKNQSNWWYNKVIVEKINYLPVRQAGIYNNPVEEGLVYKPEGYVYSSARDYSGEKGILNDVIVAK